MMNLRSAACMITFTNIKSAGLSARRGERRTTMKNLYQEQNEWAAEMTQTEGKLKKAEKPHKYEQIITVSFNKEHNGIELSFRFKPNATERAKLKRAGFKWHYKKMVWYATNNADRLAAVGTLAGTIKYPA